MPKSERILNLFPSFYRASDSSKLLVDIVRRLAEPLEEADTLLFRIQRAHRLTVAEHTEDLMRLAAVLNLTPFHFEDILSYSGLEYDNKLKLIRHRIQQVARIHLDGLGTPWAVMQSAAVFMNAGIIAPRQQAPLIQSIDAEGFSHKATIEYSNFHQKHRDHIYLHENPLIRKEINMGECLPPCSWSIDNQGMSGETPAKLVIRGIGERTIRPQIYCPQTGEGFLFNGIIYNESTLIIDEVNGAVLDGVPVDEYVIHFYGGVFDTAKTNSDACVIEENGNTGIFYGNNGTIQARPYRTRTRAPRVPAGQSFWHFNVAEGVYDSTEFEFSVFALPHKPVGIYDGDQSFDDCVFEYGASASAGMAWDERLACAFKLLLPRELPHPQKGNEKHDEVQSVSTSGTRDQSDNHVARIGNMISRFRAAGVQAYVDKAMDAWILGESIIRSETSQEGEGIDYHSTRLRHINADMIVS